MQQSEQQSLDSLNSARETCRTALAALSNFSSPDPISDPAVFLNDMLSLMSLLRASTTKLSLALKPSSPTYAASLSPLQDISYQISAISLCVRLFHATHGLTLRQEVTSLAKDMIQSVESLIQAFLDTGARSPRTSTGQVAGEYLVRVGAVHDIIDKASAPGGLSRDNVSSVKKKWAQDHDSLDDALNEVAEMVKAEGWDDDGWNELGMDSGRPMEPGELERANEIDTILRLSTLLHKRIMNDVLSRYLHSSRDQSAVQHLDKLSSLSSALLVASDDLVSALYPPQDPSVILAGLTSFISVIQHIRDTLLDLIQEFAFLEQMEALSLASEVGAQRNPRKWFEMCFHQIEKAAQSLEVILKPHGRT